MLRRRNAVRRVAGTRLRPVATVIGGLLLAVAPGAAAGQDRGGSPQALILSDPGKADELAPPSPRPAMQAFGAVQRWVRGLEVEDEADDLPRVQAAAVTLRLAGEVVGRGTAVEDGDDPVRAAAAQAIEQARYRMERSGMEPDAASELAVSLELSGAFVPIEASVLADGLLAIPPGIEGVAARLGDRTLARFPASMLERGAGPPSALSALITELSDEPGAALTSPARLREQGYEFYRFGVVHIAQPRAGTGGRFLTRGGEFVDPASVTLTRLRELADGMAGHLAARAWPGVEPYGLMGTLNPVAGRYEPRIAPPTEQAVGAFALLRYARTPGVDGAGARRAGRVARMVLESLVPEQDHQEARAWDDAVSAAATVVALSEFGADKVASDEGLASLWSRVSDVVADAVGDAGEEGSAVPPAARGLVALAGVRLAREAPERLSADAAGRAVRDAFRDTPPGMLVSLMPWLGWAEMEIAGEDAPVPAGTALLEMRASLWEHQLRLEDVDEASRDLLGGIVFTAARNPMPTWHSARPLAFLATMLGDPRLTPGGASGGEFPGELARLLDAARFLDQLAAGEAEGHMYRRPDLAAWGVRVAVWDPRMPPEATAMALLTISETLSSLRAVAERE